MSSITSSGYCWLLIALASSVVGNRQLSMKCKSPKLFNAIKNIVLQSNGILVILLLVLLGILGIVERNK